MTSDTSAVWTGTPLIPIDSARYAPAEVRIVDSDDLRIYLQDTRFYERIDVIFMCRHVDTPDWPWGPHPEIGLSDNPTAEELNTKCLLYWSEDEAPSTRNGKYVVMVTSIRGAGFMVRRTTVGSHVDKEAPVKHYGLAVTRALGLIEQIRKRKYRKADERGNRTCLKNR